jgi:dihydroorotate dehydrogenase (fumarate)
MTVDLSTTYLGLKLRSPIVASPSPLTGDPETAVKLDEAGVGAIVLPSLFEEEILAENSDLNRSLDRGTNSFAEALDYFPALGTFAGVGDLYLANLEQIKKRVSTPVIASLNATSTGGWIRYAKRMQDAGADALELNVYRVAANAAKSAEDMEAADVDLIASVRSAVTIPMAVKLSPYYTSLPGFAARVVKSGANGLVLFNRFYQPDLDLESLEVANRIALSAPWEVRLPLRWIAILRPQLGSGVAIAASSGICSGTDALKALMVGADVAMITSELLRKGPDHVRAVESEMRAWMTEHEYVSVTQLRGSASRTAVADPTAFERANYFQTLRSWSGSTR